MTQFRSLLSFICLALGVVLHLSSEEAVAQTTTQTTPTKSGTQCTDPRIRKSWDAYSADEKALYLSALAKAISRGYHQKFVQLHTETYSELEAHGTCVFLYWHRMFLLGYENMLRSMGSEYACVTIPFWDHLTNTAKYANGRCWSLEGCSPIITDFGGTVTGKDSSQNIEGVTITDTRDTICVNKGPLYNFCGNGTSCSHCIMRGYRGTSRTYPSEAYFGSVYSQVFGYDDHYTFSKAVERGVHNTVHSALGGVMTYFQSPADPLFYTHHGFIDLLQTIYLKCQLNAEGVFLTADQKGNDLRFWSNCTRRQSTANFTPNDTITMNIRDYRKVWTPVRTSPNSLLYPFFKDLPAKFVDYVDAKDLGDYSYTYQFSGALTNMYTNCKQANTITAATVTLLAEDDGNASGSGSGEQAEAGSLRPIVQMPNKFDDRMRRWTIASYELARVNGFTEEGAKSQMELILCQYKEECLGGVEDYTDLFRKNFGVEGHPRCYTLVEELKAGTKIIGVPGWRTITEKFLPCTTPKEEEDEDDDQATTEVERG